MEASRPGSGLSPEELYYQAIAEGERVEPIRDQPDLGPAQQLVIDGFLKALKERRDA